MVRQVELQSGADPGAPAVSVWVALGRFQRADRLGRKGEGLLK